VHGVAVSPNRRWLAGAAFDNQVWIWPLLDTAPVLTLTGHRRKVSGVAFSTDGHWLASVASDTTVRLWTVP
jgi:WD40 repeat protein